MARTEKNVTRMPERQAERDIPVRGGSSLRNEINRLFDRFGGRGVAPTGRRASDMLSPEDLWLGRDPFALLEGAFGGMEAFGNADLSETDEAYELQVDLPGMKKDDVSVDYSDGVLTISGERKDEREDKRKGYYLSERSYGAYQRSFRVPESVDHDNIAAQFNDGVLTITLPKTREAQQTSRRIDVKEG
ncbi:MAG: Hsp20/alpha crystallin family protein [Halofilum sp. (in: g-proteobacteria)]|nr:Hsp20/alpha crystallin family protein [Halofilum sp. (in: g-proteobacteria)]